MTTLILHIHVRSLVLPTPSTIFPGDPVTLKVIGHFPLITGAWYVATAEDGVGRALVLLQAGLISATVFLAQWHAATATHPRCVSQSLVIAAAHKTPHCPALTGCPVQSWAHQRTILATDASEGSVIHPPTGHR